MEDTTVRDTLSELNWTVFDTSHTLFELAEDQWRKGRAIIAHPAGYLPARNETDYLQDSK